MMTRHYIQENDIVMKYLRGELSVAQQVEFEQFYLDDPETLDELEAASALRAHLPQQKTLAVNRWLSLPTMVGSVVGLALGVALLLPLKRDQEPLVQPNIRTVSIDTNRGAESVIRIDRRPGEALILLRLPIAAAEDALTLVATRDGKTILETSGLSSDYLGDVTLAVPVALFTQGPTLLTLRRSDGTVLTAEQISVD